MKNVTFNKISVLVSNGLKETLTQMNFLESLSVQNVDFVNFVYKTFYTNCLPCLPGKVYNYIRNNFTYRTDEPFDEIITAPHVMYKTRVGDCDDFALFAKTVLDIIGGFKTYYILLGEQKNAFTHVAVYVNRGVYKNNFIDGVVIDGVNPNFNVIPTKYNFYKLIN